MVTPSQSAFKELDIDYRASIEFVKQAFDYAAAVERYWQWDSYPADKKQLPYEEWRARVDLRGDRREVFKPLVSLAQEQAKAIKEQHDEKYAQHIINRQIYRGLKLINQGWMIQNGTYISEDYLVNPVDRSRKPIDGSASRMMVLGEAIKRGEDGVKTWGDLIKQEKAGTPTPYNLTRLGLWLLDYPTEIEGWYLDHKNAHQTINRYRAELRLRHEFDALIATDGGERA